VDPKLKEGFETITRQLPGFVDLVSRDNADRLWIVAPRRSDAPDAFYIFDRNTKKLTPLFAENPDLAKFRLALKKPVVLKARDGLEMVSYLTTPPGIEPKKLPLVLLIHGGPWDRDSDIYDPEAQYLANRGYAVLQANYRGSTGFGIKFFNAGDLQVGLGMVEDVIHAARWAVDQGIADPKRIAAMGGSGG